MKLRLNFQEQFLAITYLVRWLAFCIAIAIVVGSASAIFLHSMELATKTRDNNHWFIWGLPFAGFAVGWLYLKFGSAVEGGNNLLIEEVRQPKNTVPLRMAPMVLFGTVVSHLFGASVGREGTAVQMGGSLADQLTKPFKLSQEERSTLLLAGISAGFASVFGTPLAGAIFGLEVVMLGRIRYQSLIPCFVAAILANQVTSLWGVHHTHYSVGTLPVISPVSLAAVIVAGIAFGLAGMIFSKGLQIAGGFMKRRITYAPLRPLIGGSMIASLIWFTDAWRFAGLGIPSIVTAFEQPVAPWDFASKMGLTIASLASGFKGGEVTPLFFVGATLGNALAPLLDLPFPMLAGLGFVAVFAAAANTPIACTLMAMELFGAEIGVFAAVACSISYLFSGNSTIYKSQEPQINKRVHH